MDPSCEQVSVLIVISTSWSSSSRTKFQASLQLPGLSGNFQKCLAATRST